MINFQNVSKKYKNKAVLKDINFTIDKGKLVVLIGSSGCGKTTTLKMINRLIDPTEGKIYINGEDIAKQDIIKLRRNIGYVIQQTGLFPHMTIKQNIEIIERLCKVPEHQIEKKTAELMDMIGMKPDEFLNRYPNQLSGGQQQRIGVARAFAMDPDIILMDEPFSALDPITRGQIQDELISIQKQFKKTIVFVTHDMGEAVELGDKLCIIKGGSIMQYDTPEMVLKKPANDFVATFVGKKRIWATPEFIKAKDIMLTTPITTLGDISVLKAMEKMKGAMVDGLLVVNKQRKLLGTINARNMQRIEDKSVAVVDVMNTDFISAKEEDSIIGLLKIVRKNNISNIPIICTDGTLKGIVTTSSLVTTLSEQFIDEEEEV